MIYNLKDEVYAGLIEVDGYLGYYYGRDNRFKKVAKVGESSSLYTILDCRFTTGINSYVEVYITSENCHHNTYDYGRHPNGMLQYTPQEKWRKISML